MTAVATVPRGYIAEIALDLIDVGRCGGVSFVGAVAATIRT